MISKTCKPGKKSISGPAQPKQELLFVNDEEEFFYEVSLTFTPHILTYIEVNMSSKSTFYWLTEV